MPGTIVFKPIEANLTHNTDLLTKMSPYCDFNVGGAHFQSQACPKGGKHPHWTEAVTVPVNQESLAFVDLMDKDKITKDEVIGSCLINLNQIERQGQVSQWYPLYYKNKRAGEIFMEAVYQPNGSFPGASHYNATHAKNEFSNMAYSGNAYKQEQAYSTQPGFAQQQQQQTFTTTQTQPVVQQQTVVHQQQQHPSTVFIEQHQVVEPRTFVKEVEVVETVPVMKEVEFMEPVKVLKEVQVTRAVPVKKRIEVAQPQVVVKEIEVIEPQLVNKTIQVVENVPVMRRIEVVELQNRVQEVETLEPQTFHKQVQVTEMVPKKKQVEVTQPVTVKKAVEFVEPVITTQTITKELHEPIIVDENVTTTVGPASVVGEITQTAYTTERLGDVMLNEKERLSTQGLSGARISEQQMFGSHARRKQGGLAQSVTLEKPVEFVEPVITTQAITKELQQPVIVDENITRTVGPQTQGLSGDRISGGRISGQEMLGSHARRKQVGVTQPVTLQKPVEFVEPAITTQNITQELQQPVIVDENIITSAGPRTQRLSGTRIGGQEMFGSPELRQGGISSNAQTRNSY